MPEQLPLTIAIILVLGVGAQWLAWRVGLPSILLLLSFGICAGPLLGWIDPDESFGELLLPFVSLSVAMILYEGGLTLKLSELPKVGGVVRNLVTIGAAATGVVTALAAHWIFDLDAALSALVGAVLAVTGPTVIGPLLRHIRPTGDVGPILRWEGIVIDPIGALLTVLIFEAFLVGETEHAAAHLVTGVLKTIVFGGGLGVLAAAVLVLVIARHWIADYLENAASLMLVVATFTISNHFQPESGLLAVTVMGLVLVNQKFADVQHIVEFKENVRVLLISSLFIVLAARLELADLTALALPGILFIAVIVLIGRPLCVLISTLRSQLPMRQRMFLAWMAPRGIVAAAVSSIFALRLEAADYPKAELLVPIAFMTIISTVAIYGLSSPFVARRLGLADSNPQGTLFAGAHSFARDVALLLQEQGFRVLLVDNNWRNVNTARMAGLPAYHGSILAEHAIDEIDLGGIGRLLAVTPNEWVNVLAVHRFERIFGRGQCYQLPPQRERAKRERFKYLHGRWLFGEDLNYPAIQQRCTSGCTIKATRLSEEFDYAAFRERYGESATLLFVVDEGACLHPVTAEKVSDPQPGQTLVSLVQSLGESSETEQAE